MAISPRAFRLKLQGRLLLLCFGAALPVTTVFALSLADQYHLLQSAEQKTEKAKVFALAKDVDIWAKGQIFDLKLLSEHSLSKELLNGVLKRHRAWSEIYRLFPDGRVLAYYPASNGPTKALSIPPELFASNDESINSFYGPSSLSGKEKFLLISSYKTAPKAIHNTTAPKIPAKAPVFARKHRSIKIRTKHGRPIAKAIPQKATANLDFFNSKLVVAINPKELVKVLSDAQSDLNTALDDGCNFSTLALADSQKNSFAYVSESKKSNRSQIEKYIPTLGIYILATEPDTYLDSAANAWLTQTLLLALVAILASSYLAFLASKHFSRQIKLLVKDVIALGHGDFSKRLEVRSNDELGKLAKAVNQIASKMQTDHDQRCMEEKISQAIRQSLDLDQVLMATVTELGKALEVSRCCLALIDSAALKDKKRQNKLELIFDYVWYDENKKGKTLDNRSLIIEDDGIMNMIIEQGSILSLDVLDEDGPTPLFENGKTAPEDWRSIKSLIACPVTSAEGTIGLILIQQCDRLRTWTDKELELVEVVTRQLTVAMQHAHLFYYTRTMAEQEMLINQIVRCVRSSLDLDTILNTVTHELCSAIGADRCQILQPDTTGPLVVTHEYYNDSLAPTKTINLYAQDAQEINFSPEYTEAVFTRGNFLLGIDLEKLSRRSTDASLENIKKDQPYDPWLVAVISDTESDPRAAAFKYFLLSSNSKSLIAAPLLHKNRIIGLLVVHQCDNPRTWRSGEVQLVGAIADQLALAVTQASLFAQVKYQAITDGLTGLYNHIYFQNRLKEELRLADRKNLPCSLLMLDLDNLKQINDTYGHPVGDAAIRSVAAALKTLLRSGDTASRYGGEEFAIILPETSLLEAALIGDRLCTHIAANKVPGLGQITISVGAASYPRQANDATELISKADQALYEAKRSGRNQIWISDSVSEKALPDGQIVPEFRVTKRLAIAGNRKEEDNRNVHKQTKIE